MAESDEREHQHEIQSADTLPSDGEHPRAVLTLPSPPAVDPRTKEMVKRAVLGATPPNIGKYTVRRRIGSGGMGVVYEAYDKSLDRTVAVKVLRMDDAADAEARAKRAAKNIRMQREAQAMAKLSHANIVQVYEVGTDDHGVYIAMELVDGQSLDVWLKEKKRAWSEILAVFVHAGRGLASAHRVGIVHRDFKPQNVIVGPDGSAKVLDFGLAHADASRIDNDQGPCDVKPGEPARNLLSTKLTATNAMMGTWAYMAPEQFEFKPADRRSDQYSFCVSLMEGLFGEHPFDISNLERLIYSVMTQQLKAPRNMDVPAWLHRVLLRGLAVDPGRRYSSMDVLLTELGKDPARWRQRWLPRAAFVGVVGGFTVATLMLRVPPICRDTAPRISGVWNDDRSASTRSALLAADSPLGEETWSRVRHEMDTYAAAATELLADSCETLQSGELFERRMACLKKSLTSASTLIEQLATADTKLVPQAVRAAQQVNEALVKCGDDEALLARLAPPFTADEVAVEQARDDLAQAHVLEGLGIYDRSREIVDAVASSEVAMRYLPLHAEALLQSGALHILEEQPKAAHDDLEHARDLAVTARHDRVVAQAISRDLYVWGWLLKQPADAMKDLGHGEAWIRSLPGEHLIHGEFLNNRAMVHYAAGDLQRAQDGMLEAIAYKQRWLPNNFRELFYSRSNLAAVWQDARRFSDAVVEFETILVDTQRELGLYHPISAQIEANLAYALRESGEPRAAIQHFQNALDVYADLGMSPLPAPEHFDVEIGAALFMLHEYNQARVRYDSAAGRLAVPAQDPEALKQQKTIAAGLHEGLGDLALATGDLQAARREHKQSVAIRVELNGPKHFDVAYGEARFATMLIRAGLGDEALGHIRTALLIYGNSPIADSQTAELRELAARAELLRGDVPAADSTSYNP